LVKMSYDPDVDILYIRLGDGVEYDVIEAGDAEVHVDEKGKVLAIEVWNASRNGLKEIIELQTSTQQQ